MRRILAGCALVGVAVGLTARPGSNAVVEARMVLATEAAHPGSAIKAAVVARIAPGYHINDHKPTQDYLVPTELKLEPTKQLSLEKVVYPKGEAKKFAFSDTALSVYEGTVAVGAILKTERAVQPGTYTIKGEFRYQACSEDACLPPTAVPLTLTVKVVPRGIPVKRTNVDVFNRIQFN